MRGCLSSLCIACNCAPTFCVCVCVLVHACECVHRACATVGPWIHVSICVSVCVKQHVTYVWKDITVCLSLCTEHNTIRVCRWVRARGLFWHACAQPIAMPPDRWACLDCVLLRFISLSPFLTSQLKYKKDLRKMKGSSHFHSLTAEDNLALKNARKINKIVSEVRWRLADDGLGCSV